MSSSIKLVAIAALLSGVSAQQTVWGQCGGIAWVGPTTCVSGSTCVFARDWFSQCLPNQPSVTQSSPTKLATTSKLSTTFTETFKTTTTKKTTASKPSTTLKTTKSSKTSTSKQTTTAKTTATITQTTTQITSKTTTSTQPAETGYTYLFSFGDSYSQTGFDLAGTKPSPGNQLGNPPFPGWTTSGGPNYIGYLLSSNPTLLSYNLASGGATTDALLVTPYAPTVLSFVDQVSQFSTNLANQPAFAPWTSSNALFAVWIGVNDVGNAWYRPEWPTLSQAIINRYFEQVQILYNAGARNFVFLNVPPIQRTPAMLQQDVANQQAEGVAIAGFNSLMATAFSGFKSLNSGVKAWLVDTGIPFNAALDNPTAYGAANAECYNADGVSCLWWNDYHPGMKIQELVGDAVAAAVGLSL